MPIIIFAVALFVIGLACVTYEENKKIHNQREERMKNYTEDIDFSLAAKGYPVVNDVDIEYTKWNKDAVDNSPPKLPSNPNGKYHDMWEKELAS